MFDRFKRGVDVAKFKADQLMRANRVQNEIGGLRREIQNVREKIANDVIELHKQTALSHAGLDELCVQIDQFEAQIGEKEKQIESIRAEQPPEVIKAPPTAAPQSSEATAAPQIIDAEPASTPDASKCANCGAALQANVEFCPECGTRVATVEA
jgi:hypothetical protein